MNKLPLYIFEDPGWRRFGPLTTLRPVWDLRIGLETLAERITRQLDISPSGYFPRTSLKPLVDEAKSGMMLQDIPSEGDVFLVNGRAVKNINTAGLAEKCPWTVWTDGPDIVAARLPADIARKWVTRDIYDPSEYSARALLAIWGIETTAPEVQLVDNPDSLVYWPWEMLKLQEELIKEDFDRLGFGRISGEVDHRAILVEPDNIHINEGAIVSAGAILDASNGPIILGEGVKVSPGAIIIGPAVLGNDCYVKPGAKLLGPLTIGPACKLGGEIEDCIFQGYSNKQHDGFLGNALLGEWVNLGADTNNSDLKNNYSNVKVTIDGEIIDTGETFFGSIIGDHVKTAINTQLNTGTVIGIGTNIFGAGFPPKAVGAYRWGGASGLEMYDFDKFLHTAKVAMKRRDRVLSPAMENLLKQLYQKAERNEI